eukprot:929454-Prymnesium_polylepis.1
MSHALEHEVPGAFPVCNTEEKSCCIPPLQPLYITLALSRADCRALQPHSRLQYTAIQLSTCTRVRYTRLYSIV